MAFFFYLDEYFTSPKEDHLRTWQNLYSQITDRFGASDDPRKELNRWSVSLSTYMAGIPRGVYFLYEEDAIAFKLAFSKAVQRPGGFGK